MRTELLVSTYPYVNDDDYSEQIIIFEMYRDADSSFTKNLKTFKNLIDGYIDDIRHPSHTGNEYDCSRLPFGSRFERLDYKSTQYSYVAIYKHSYSIDV